AGMTASPSARAVTARQRLIMERFSIGYGPADGPRVLRAFTLEESARPVKLERSGSMRARSRERRVGASHPALTRPGSGTPRHPAYPPSPDTRILTVRPSRSG